MIQNETLNISLLAALLDSLVEPVTFVDTEHIIRYMNKAAIAQYQKRGGANLLGRSLLDCHNAKSNKIIMEVVEAFQAGEDERFLNENAKRRLFMRAVRDAEGRLLGYYERFEPPAK